MSRSNPTLTNPAAHFFEWKGGAGKLQWYNKEAEKNVEVRLPFEFLVLDELATITGYNKRDESGFWSNEVRNIKRDTLYVKTRRGPFEAALYENLTQTLKGGGKYAKSIYIAHKGEGGKYMIGNIKAHGSALSAWIEFSKKHAVETGKVIMKRGEVQQTPKGDDYYPPVFEWAQTEEAENQEAVRLDKELQIYLSQYLAAPKGDEDLDAAENLDDVGKATPEQVADFENRRQNAGHGRSARADDLPPAKPDVVIEDIGDEPINLDDIPF